MPHLRRYAVWYALVMAFGMGAYVRLQPVLTADFPLMDGGLFYLMVQELRQAGYALPTHTGYNNAGIPFTYPPLAFYLTAVVADVTRWPLSDIVRLLPPVLSTLTIPAFFMFSRTMLRSAQRAALATVAFALLPYTFEWYIVGGGLTRAPGFLLAILALHGAYLTYTRRQWRYVALTTLLSAATLLTHPTMTWFLAYSLAIFGLFLGRDRTGVLHTLLVAAGVGVLSAPWWMTVMSRHGVEPFLLAAQSGQKGGALSTLLLASGLFSEPLPAWPDLVATVIFAGVALVAPRRYLLPLWMIALLALHPRGGSTHVMVPLSMLVGTALGHLLLRPYSTKTYKLAACVVAAILAGIAGEYLAVQAGGGAAYALTVVALLFALAFGRVVLRQGNQTLIAGYFALSAVIFATTLARSKLSLPMLQRPERNAMRWIAAHTPANSTFIVLPPEYSTPTDWGREPALEWFPVLAQRVSLTTVQGYEWLPRARYFERIERFGVLTECASRDAACIERWGQRFNLSFTHVYVPAADEARGWRALRRSMQATPNYKKVYENAGVTIFARVPE